MKKSNKFSPVVRERAVRLVQQHRVGYQSLWAASGVDRTEDWLRAADAAGIGQAS